MADSKQAVPEKSGPVLIKNAAGRHLFVDKETADKLVCDSEKALARAKLNDLPKAEWPKVVEIVDPKNANYAKLCDEANGKNYDTGKGERKA